VQLKVLGSISGRDKINDRSKNKGGGEWDDGVEGGDEGARGVGWG